MRVLLSHPLHHSQLKQSLKKILQHRKRARAQADGRQSGARDGVPPVRVSQCRCCCCHHHDVQSGAPQEAVESCQAVTLVATWVSLFLFLLLMKQKKKV